MGAFFQNKIKEKREEAGLTQKQLGDRIGADDTLISKYETGEALPTYDKLLKMASIFHTTTEELMGVKRREERKYNEAGERILNIENGEIVRRQFMSRVNDEAATLTPDGVSFSTQCIRKWEGIDYIQIIIVKEQKLMIIRKSNEDELDAQRWCRIKDGKIIRRKITGREFSARLYKMMNWNRGYSHKISGYIGVNEADPTEKMWFFELSEAEASPIMTRSRLKMGVFDSELDEKTIERLKDIENEKAEEKERRQKAKGDGKDPGPVTQYILYPDDWGQYTFGPPPAEHKVKAKIRIEDTGGEE
ncbi:MAG: helix-turn-helix transcriptional regulator [Butyrivibrio sp.]|uniref:helix-turn-helix transcriptional regulator n=1 Tax=Butyrivibrio sp. INlla21 TaxID=1520811 RepID=UPI0008EFB32B|nr:helix-turn-helix transcriptional regulator [Butyrivibrio sp. INlla21]MEE3495214.1 helix-turn-helix transcriptional regulator [Butyrivibrio sp.]SFU88653.1 DNA-binding transcriptional regulator, XRE-family HTH domain [Butyrivibrio sp. INlla21]